MKRLLRNSKLVLVSAVLALVGLTFAANPRLAAHAASQSSITTLSPIPRPLPGIVLNAAASQPSISAYGFQEAVEVQGRGFTPRGTVWVGVYDARYRLLNARYVSASQNIVYCSPLTHLCRVLVPGGAIDAFEGIAPYYGYVHVIAYDFSTSTWSNYATTYVRIIP